MSFPGDHDYRPIVVQDHAIAECRRRWHELHSKRYEQNYLAARSGGTGTSALCSGHKDLEAASIAKRALLQVSSGQIGS
jgi:hypothetical protein